MIAEFNITDDYYNWKNNFSKNNNRNSSSNEISYEFFNIFKERSSTILTAHWICFGLGSAAVFINLYLMVSIMINRKTLIKNVFYALVLHCAFVDLMRSAALIIWCLPGLRLVDFAAFATVKQLLLIVLRSLNLLTALNLLVFTVNEYVLVSKPLHYKRVIRRRLIAILIGLSWILSLTFVLGGVFAQSFTPGIQQVYILSEKEGNKNKNDDHLNETYGSKIAGYDDEDENEDNMKLAESGVKGGDFDDGEFFHNFHSSRNINGTFSRNYSGIFDWNETSRFMSSKNFFLARNQFNNDPAHYTSIFAVMIVCFVCLFIVVTCYSMILYRIRKFHISNRSRRIFQQNLHRNQSSGISQKRPIIFQKGGRQQDAIVVEQIPPIRHSLKREFFSNTLSPKHLESPEKSQLKNSPSKRSVASGLSTINIYRNEETIFFDETAPEKSPPPAFNFVCCLNKSERFSKISRLKYIVVVGFVLIVDILFLLSYSIIQIFQYLHISQKNANYYDPNDMLFLRYVLQILIGVHSVLQPLCYFRVRNFCRPLLFFDRLKKFGGKKKRRRKMTTTRRNHQNNISVSNNGNYCQTAGKISRNMSRDASKKFSDKNFTFSNRKIRVDSMERRNKRLASSSIDEL